MSPLCSVYINNLLKTTLIREVGGKGVEKMNELLQRLCSQNHRKTKNTIEMKNGLPFSVPFPPSFLLSYPVGPQAP